MWYNIPLSLVLSRLCFPSPPLSCPSPHTLVSTHLSPTSMSM